MTKATIHASRNAALVWLPSAEMLVVPLVAAAFLSLTDAFDLHVLPLAERFFYWLVLLAIGQSASVLIRGSLDRMPISRARLVLAGILRCVLGSLPMTVAVWLLTSLALSQPLRIARLPDFYLPVLVVTAAMVAINLLAQRRPVETHRTNSDGEAATGAGAAPILARLPPRLKGATLYAVEAEDHYIRLHTSAGSDLVLLRFADALTELRGIEGAQIHRSWWVARDAVETSHRADGKLFLVLHGGVKAPVSRSYTRVLRAQGWL
ncbi:MAG: LytTR family transcriptional regulator [Alphaproteobacteria bacterium]|nr:LytTR family transcriptional regulator [Alphaproteobacteria bacterium]MDE2495352.1 LytTR family transcriptional regulator [Alphaproteobacteria bacterium]